MSGKIITSSDAEYFIIQYFNNNKKPWSMFSKGLDDPGKTKILQEGLAQSLRGSSGPQVHIRDVILGALEIYSERYFKLDYPDK